MMKIKNTVKFLPLMLALSFNVKADVQNTVNVLEPPLLLTSEEAVIDTLDSHKDTTSISLNTKSNKENSTKDKSLNQIKKTKVYNASWYGPGFSGRKTASGEIFNMNAMTFAHKKLPFGTRVKFTCTTTGKSVIARVNDRGPYIHNREFDLSKGVAKSLGIIDKGVGQVYAEVIK